MSREANLLNKEFGFLQAIEKMSYTENRYNVWRCYCNNCGGEIFVNTKKLNRGTITNCGCIPKANAQNGSIAEDLTGQIFGSLTVLHRVENHQNGRTRWLCECICKNSTVVTAHELKAGKTTSCGCYKPSRPVDIRNQTFGRLTALSPTDKRDYKGSIIWSCRCQCGNKLEVSADDLVHGNYRSCGCLKKEIQKNIPLTLHLIDSTCVEWLEKRKHRCDNTSGFRGVYVLKNNRYRATIGFKRKLYYLGTYNTFEEAVKIRLEVEKILHDGFVNAYHLWEVRASSDPEWAEINHFYFDVLRDGDEFIVSTTPLE